jgi:hypothetical protein
MTRARFSHSEIHGSKLAWQLPVAYRSLQRPSSASSAKASTGCPLQLAETMLALAMEFSKVATWIRSGAFADDASRLEAGRSPRGSPRVRAPAPFETADRRDEGCATASFKAAQCAR